MYGKEGVTGWMFHQMPYDGGVAFSGNNVWGWADGTPDGNGYGQKIKTRHVFYGGFGDDALHLNIKPIDILGLNVVIPFNGGETADAFGNIKAQVDVNLDFGNIAVTFDSFKDVKEDVSGGTIYVYYGGSFGDLGLDFGLSFAFNDLEGDEAKPPIGVGLGVKFATDSFGIKFRTVATLAGGDKETKILAELLPYFPLGDNIAAFVGLGLSMTMFDPDKVVGDNPSSVMGWHFNPYIRIGEEWGAQFLVGVKLWSGGDADVDKATPPNKGIIHWSVPIAIMISF